MPTKFIDKKNQEYFLDNNNKLYTIVAGKKIIFEHFFIAKLDKNFYQGFLEVLGKKRFIVNAWYFHSSYYLIIVGWLKILGFLIFDN